MSEYSSLADQTFQVNASAVDMKMVHSAAQVSKAIESVNEITQSAASSAEEMASSVEEMASMAQELHGLVRRFRLEGEKSGGHSLTRPADCRCGNRLSPNRAEQVDLVPVSRLFVHRQHAGLHRGRRHEQTLGGFAAAFALEYQGRHLTFSRGEAVVVAAGFVQLESETR